MAASEIEFTIVARDEAYAVLRQISREATRTFALMHQRLVVALWATLLVLFGAALGAGCAALWL